MPKIAVLVRDDETTHAHYLSVQRIPHVGELVSVEDGVTEPRDHKVVSVKHLATDGNGELEPVTIVTLVTIR